MDLKEIFGTRSDAETAERFEAYKTALNESARESLSGRVRVAGDVQGGAGSRIAGAEGSGLMLVKSEGDAEVLNAIFGQEHLSKAVDPAMLQSVMQQVEAARAAQADLLKDFSLTSPLSTGFVPFDLEAPAKLLFPRPTPLRNRITRTKGQGTARRFKRLTGITGSGTGGVGLQRPGITDSTTTTFGSLSMRRGPKISYAADEDTVTYRQFSLSDAVPWSAQFSGQGFQDIRQLSQTSLLYASMLAEERMIIGGRRTALGAPTFTLAQRAAGTGETGLQGGRYWLKLTTDTVWGESVLSASVDLDTVTAGNVIDVSITDVAGALGYRVYAARVAAAGADPGDASKFFQGRTGYNKFVLTGNPLITTGRAASDVAADGTASTEDYDGLFTLLQANGGYTKRLNAAFSTSNPGVEYQDAFSDLWDDVKADPDEVLMAGSDRKQLSDLLKTASSANYRLTVEEGAREGTFLGAIVNGLLNEITGKMVSVSVHPWFPQGNSMVMSWTLPIPDSEVTNVVEVCNVQDYMAVQWPVTQFLYEASSYWYGTLVFYAPAWCGQVLGIKLA